MKILDSEITGMQTKFSTNFDGKLSFILSFLFPELISAATYIFTAPTCKTNYYGYSRTLCIKCWVSAFPTEI
jgi:hypothetical protein